MEYNTYCQRNVHSSHLYSSSSSSLVLTSIQSSLSLTPLEQVTTKYTRYMHFECKPYIFKTQRNAYGTVSSVHFKPCASDVVVVDDRLYVLFRLYIEYFRNIFWFSKKQIKIPVQCLVHTKGIFTEFVIFVVFSIALLINAYQRTMWCMWCWIELRVVW